jgi:autotransporter-associated beta strand protein
MFFIAESLLADPTLLPLWVVFLYSAALYPLGMMFGCSVCCGTCQQCTLCGDECLPDGWICCGSTPHHPPPEGGNIKAFVGCCGGEWHDTRNDSDQGICCDDVWHAGYPQPIGCDHHCCDGVWHEDEGGCCGVNCEEWNSGPGECCGGEWKTSDGVCCNSEWHTDEGVCCDGSWHPADAGPGECVVCDGGGPRVWVPQGWKKCEPRADYCDCLCLVIPESLDCDDVCCDHGNGVYEKVNGKCRQRCCVGGICYQLWEEQCIGPVYNGVPLFGCCYTNPTCPAACCEESDQGDQQCKFLGEFDADIVGCKGTMSFDLPLACPDDCLKGACCTGIEGDPRDLGSEISCGDAGGECVDSTTGGGAVTPEECAALGGVFLGAGSSCSSDLNACRSPYTENCCEHKVSTSSGLTFTQPFRKRSPPCKNLVSWTATGWTDSPILIHGVPFGTKGKHCRFEVGGSLCNNSFHVEPVPCGTDFKKLDIEVCWSCELSDEECAAAEASETWQTHHFERINGQSQPYINFSGCDNLEFTLGNCHCRCETRLRYNGNSVSSNSKLIMNGSARIEAMGGALVLTTAIAQTGSCNRTLTLDGTSGADNALPALGDPSSGKTSLVKTGTGYWRLKTNSYTGSTNITAGAIVVTASTNSGASGAFGNADDTTLSGRPVLDNAAVYLVDGITCGRQLEITSGGATLGGIHTSGISTFGQDNRRFFVGGDLLLVAAGGGTVRFRPEWVTASGDSAITASVTVGDASNEGTVELLSSLYTLGSVTVAYGTFSVTGSYSSLYSDVGVTISSGSTFRWEALAPSYSSLKINGGTLSGRGDIQAYDGVVLDYAGATISVGTGDVLTIGNFPGADSTVLSGSGVLTKTGGGTLVIDGTSTFGGTTTVSAGSLVVQFSSGLATSATFTNTTLSVAFSADPASGATYTLLSGPTAQTYGSVTLTGTSATGTYNSTTSVLTID